MNIRFFVVFFLSSFIFDQVIALPDHLVENTEEPMLVFQKRSGIIEQVSEKVDTISYCIDLIKEIGGLVIATKLWEMMLHRVLSSSNEHILLPYIPYGVYFMYKIGKKYYETQRTYHFFMLGWFFDKLRNVSLSLETVQTILKIAAAHAVITRNISFLMKLKSYMIKIGLLDRKIISFQNSLSIDTIFNKFFNKKHTITNLTSFL